MNTLWIILSMIGFGLMVGIVFILVDTILTIPSELDEDEWDP